MEPKKTRKRTLTPKQIKFVAGIMKGKNKTQAYIDAYDVKDKTTKLSNRTNAQKVYNTPNIQNALEPYLKKHDLTLDRALAPLNKALSAKKMVVTKEGEIYESDLDDLDMQLKASDRVLKLHGINKDNNPTTLNFINIANEQKEKYNL